MNRPHCSEETKRKIGEANRGRKHTSEELEKMRAAHLGTRHRPEEIEKIRISKLGDRNPNFGHHASPETRAKMSEARTGERNAFYGRHHTQETRQKLSIASSGPRNFNYGKPRADEVVRKILKSNHLKPNKAERHLQSILDANFPDLWKFVGDGQFTVGGLCPDFLYVGGEKWVIELFGTYWHSARIIERVSQTERGRIVHYLNYGFNCLVIWENELKDEDQVAEKIRRWVRTAK